MTVLAALQEELRHATTRADASKDLLDSLTRAYVDVRSGVAHLSTMVAVLPLNAPPVPFDDELLGDVLAQVRSCCCRDAEELPAPTCQSLNVSRCHYNSCHRRCGVTCGMTPGTFCTRTPLDGTLTCPPA
jgi:hypothetical protein